MRLLIKNLSKLYTPDTKKDFGNLTEIDNPQIIIRDDKIEQILSSNIESDNKFDNVIDANGACLLPGFVDAHTHPVFWNTRENEFIMRLEGKSYEEIAASGGGIRNSARNFRLAKKDEIKELTRKRIKEFIEYGTTTIEAKSGYGLSTEDEIKSLEIISELNTEQPLDMIPTFLGAHEVPDEYRKDRKSYIRLIIDEMIPMVSKRNLAQYCDVFCEKDVFSIEETREILQAAMKHGLKARIHADELSASGGAELAAELKAVSADHLIKISDKGISEMAESGVFQILLPTTTFFLRKNEYAPARKMIDSGCQLVIATDFNPGSSMTQNMQLVWSVAAIKMGLLPNELLWATTYNPACSLHLENKIGSIEVGKQADLILLDIPSLDYLPYHLGRNHLVMTMKKGQIIYKKVDKYQ